MREISNIKTKKKSNEHMRISIILTLLLFFPLFNLTFAKDFSNPNAEIHYKLNPDGTVDVIEKIGYDLFGCDFCFHELYTWHPYSVKIKNASGYCVNAKCRFFTKEYEDRLELILRNDEGFKEGFYIAVFSYIIDEEILEQKDVAQFFYKVWYDQWPKNVDEINIYITFPGDVDDVKYFIHPPEFFHISVNKKDRNTLHIKAVNHPHNQYIEINALMPKKWFNKLKKADRYMSAEEIIRGEEFHIFIRKVTLLIIILFLLSPIVFLAFIYLKYGREEPFDTSSLPPYIRDISEIGNLSPTEAAVLLNPSSNVNLSNIISAELLELYRLGYLDIVEKEITDEPINQKRKVIALKPIEGKDLSKLTEIQRNLYEFISNYKFISKDTKDNTFSFDEALRDVITSLYIRRMFEEVRKKIEEMPEEKYLDKKGVEIFGKFYVFCFFIGFIFIGGLSKLRLIAESYLTLISLVWFFYLVILGLILINRAFLGKWTREGRLIHEKLKRYKKFMEDLTLMREKGVSEVILWEKLLVYATAFGVANKVIEALKAYYPNYQKDTSIKYLSLSAVSLSNSLHNITRSMSPGGRGGFGSGGGGGGGGGGAR